MKKILNAIAFFLLVSCAGNKADVRVITDFYKETPNNVGESSIL